jgi:hypothetical protein
MKRGSIRLYKVKQSTIDKLNKLIETEDVKRSIEVFSVYGRSKNKM